MQIHRAVPFLVSLACCILTLAWPTAPQEPPADPQFFYYGRDGVKIPFELCPQIITVKFKEGVSFDVQQSVINAESSLYHPPMVYSGCGSWSYWTGEARVSLFGLSFRTSPCATSDSVLATIESLNYNPGVQFATPTFTSTPPRIGFGIDDQFVVRFKDDVSNDQIAAMNAENGVLVSQRSPYYPTVMLLRVIMNILDRAAANYSILIANSLDMANRYYESGAAIYSQPNLVLIDALCQPGDWVVEPPWECPEPSEPEVSVPEEDIAPEPETPELEEVREGETDVHEFDIEEPLLEDPIIVEPPEMELSVDLIEEPPIEISDMVSDSTPDAEPEEDEVEELTPTPPPEPGEAEVEEPPLTPTPTPTPPLEPEEREGEGDGEREPESGKEGEGEIEKEVERGGEGEAERDGEGEIQKLTPTPTHTPPTISVCQASRLTASTALAAKIERLREWRDGEVLSSWLGEKLAAKYYGRQKAVGRNRAIGNGQ